MPLAQCGIQILGTHQTSNAAMSSGKGLSVFLVKATQRCILCLTCDTTVDTCVVFSDVLAGKDLVCPHQFIARTRSRAALTPARVFPCASLDKW